jgi:acetolactate synthase regulatory subunit
MNQEAIEEFPGWVQRALAAAGLGGAELLSVRPESPGFGDCAATFRLGHVLLRVVRDRGESFVDLAAASHPDRFSQYDDIEIAMGWRSVEEVLARKQPEKLERVLERIRARLTELNAAFSAAEALLTEARVREAAKVRGDAFISKLSQH